MKTKTMFVCQECGSQSPRWLGKCPGCGSWNSYVEEVQSQVTHPRQAVEIASQAPVMLKDVATQDEKRLVSGFGEFDRVLGGGIVLGSVTLIGGDPGIGKSTIALQVACGLSKKNYKILYVSGEESIKQTKLRAQRLVSGPTSGREDSIYIVNQIDLDVIFDYVKKMQPDVVVIDSIQVIFKQELSSTPGSVSQVRECAAILTQLAKSTGIAMVLIGHVTKDGMLAGPRVLEHIVDTVLYFEGERYSMYRVLRSTKNRFGSTNEIGVFEMSSTGLTEVTNPSEIFLAERPEGAAGSVVTPIMEGTRPFLVEIQGLVSRSSFGIVRQKAQGFDANRLALLIAVLEKRINLNLQDKDIFLNVVGGVKVYDPAADLAVVTAVASALLDKPLPADTVVFGEVGLSSEVRSVSHVALRVNEAERLGFKKCIIPKNNLNASTDFKAKNIDILAVENVKQALSYLE